jgi:hypothetical protein
MSDAYVIPLSPTPQTLAITLGGVGYRLTVRWNEHAACWMLNLADTAGVAIVAGIALTAGVDLLGQYKYLRLGGKLYAQSDASIDTPPALDNLGVTARLYWVPA